jgi:hypothetical protein
MNITVSRERVHPQKGVKMVDQQFIRDAIFNGQGMGETGTRIRNTLRF